MAVSNHLAFPSEDNERSDRREATRLTCTVQALRGPPSPARMTDVSRFGCALAGCTLRRGDEIWLRTTTLPPFRATILWVRGDKAGCRFYAPLRPSELLRLKAPN